MPTHKKSLDRILAEESRALAVERDGPSLAALNRSLIEGPQTPEARAALEEVRKDIVFEID
jgi:hypothetical protein